MERRTYKTPEYTSPQQDVVNVGFRGETPTERILSNFADTPIILDDVEYANVESFWQSLYFPEGSLERERISSLSGREAKNTARKKPKDLTHVTYMGKSIEVGSEEHQALMYQALEAKYSQNEEARELLLSTAGKQITHVLTYPDGRIQPDSTTIPRAIFSQMLMDIRDGYLS